MPHKPNEGYGKLIKHGEPSDAPSDDALEERSRELAEIAGRSEVTDEDRRLAHAELHGVASRDSDNDLDVDEAESRDPSDPAGGSQGKVPRIETEDENEAANQAVLEGVEEAEHDQMLAARRSIDREDADDER